MTAIERTANMFADVLISKNEKNNKERSKTDGRDEQIRMVDESEALCNRY
jgi:hypothetical protein